MVTKPPLRPGLAKVGRPPLLRHRTLTLVSATEGRVRDMLETADVMSEGATRTEDGARVYYGSTSIIVHATDEWGFPSETETTARAKLLLLRGLMESDPHVRVRALRIAHREASTRAGAALGTMRTEVDVAMSQQGIAITVDVVASVGRKRAGSSQR